MYDFNKDWFRGDALLKPERPTEGLPPGTHRCTSCKKVKPIDDFYARSKTNYIRQGEKTASQFNSGRI